MKLLVCIVISYTITRNNIIINESVESNEVCNQDMYDQQCCKIISEAGRQRIVVKVCFSSAFCPLHTTNQSDPNHFHQRFNKKYLFVNRLHIILCHRMKVKKNISPTTKFCHEMIFCQSGYSSGGCM